jgi:molecular chaperone GrpE
MAGDRYRIPFDGGEGREELGRAPRPEPTARPDRERVEHPGTEPVDAPLDPTLEEDLGAEYEFVVEERLEHEVLKDALDEAQAEAKTNLELAQRTQAEMENYRKRIAREQADAVARAGQRVVEELLPVLDNLERAIDHTVAGGDIKELLKGVEMVHGQISDVFAKEGVEVQDPFGKTFDPELHQAVAQKEDPTVPEGTVLEVYRKGYVMAGRVVRPAQVVVSTGGPPPQEG